MITIGIVLLVVGVIALAFDRALPQTRPVSTLVMYLGVSLGLILLAVGLIVLALSGGAVNVDSLGVS